MLQMTQYTGTKTIKACPMTLGEAEKVLGRSIDTSSVEDRNSTPGYLVEYADGYRSWSPKEIFERSYRISETHIDRMLIEKEELEKRFLAGRKFTFSSVFASLNEKQRNLLRRQLNVMEDYLYLLCERIGVEDAAETERKLRHFGENGQGPSPKKE